MISIFRIYLSPWNLSGYAWKPCYSKIQPFSQR